MASKTNNWEAIAINLGVQPVDIDRIKKECSSDIGDYFLKLFDLWRKRGSPPFTLHTMLSALESESVGELVLAERLREKYLL